jgi:phosphatidylserine/phosphatidylglycerophosphate/cardiolipin synthase-like enzyme
MRQNIMKRFFVVGLICLTAVVFADAPQDVQLEVVTSLPTETTLERQGTKNTADTWVEMVKGARKTLDFAEFYLSTKNSEPLELVIKAVIDAAARGVRVRFLVGTPINDDMKARTDEVLSRFKSQTNIEFVFFNWKKLTGGILHAKYFIVDGREAFLGSQNFDWRSLKHIHETGLRIRSKVFAEALMRIFEADWQYNRGDKEAYKKLKKQKPIAFPKGEFLAAAPEPYNPPGIDSAIKTLTGLIDKAGKKITVQLLNFSEEIYGKEESFTLISDALTRAAKRGVTVRMLVSDWNKRKSRVIALKKLVQIPNIAVRFVVIPRSKEGFIPYARVIHSKVMRVDDRVSWVGTSNWGYSYFYKSRNVEVVTHSPAVARTLDRLFDQLWNSTYTEPVDPLKEYVEPRVR